MSIFVAGLMTAGNLLSVFDEQGIAKNNFALVKNFNAVTGGYYVDEQPYWMEYHREEAQE